MEKVTGDEEYKESSSKIKILKEDDSEGILVESNSMIKWQSGKEQQIYLSNNKMSRQLKLSYIR